MDAQRTIRRQISCVGIGLHSGNKVNLTLKPAPTDFGIRFRRTDLGDHEVPATVQNLAGIQLATGLASNEVSVETVEHLLAALVSVGIDNVIVELNSPEVPIMDGSAAPFVYLIHEAGVKRLQTPRKYLKIIRPPTGWAVLVRARTGPPGSVPSPTDRAEPPLQASPPR